MFIPTQIVNFALVPTHLRFVTIGVVSLFWSASSLSLSPLHSPLHSPVTNTVRAVANVNPLADAYLSSVNAKKQAQIAAEHAHAHTPEDEKKISEVA